MSGNLQLPGADAASEPERRLVAVRNWGPKKKPPAEPTKQSGEISEFTGKEIVQRSSQPLSRERQRVLEACKIFADLRSETNISTHAPSTSKIMREQGQWLNPDTHYIGHTPGVEIGDVFHFRAELMIVNLHRRPEAGISFIRADINKWKKPVANSIVVSAGYYANKHHGQCFVYSGSGEKTKDQELLQGNLALANSCILDVPVRVIRVFEVNSQQQKSFRYEGLFYVIRYWKEKSSAGFFEYKFLMEPCVDPPPATVRIKDPLLHLFPQERASDTASRRHDSRRKR